MEITKLCILLHIIGGNYFYDPQFLNRLSTKNLSTLLWLISEEGFVKKKTKYIMPYPKHQY